jgi:hypothetical protein
MYLRVRKLIWEAEYEDTGARNRPAFWENVSGHFESI